MALWIDGLPRPDHGPGMVQRVCDACKAGWVGAADDPCQWCIDRDLDLVADERRLLLDPPWLRSDAGSSRYDQLTEVDKMVWDRTRGQSRGADSVLTWVARLRRAVDTGLVTRREAEKAIRRVSE